MYVCVSGIRNVSFLGNFAYVRNESSLVKKFGRVRGRTFLFCELCFWKFIKS